MSQKKIKIMMRLRFPATSDSSCHFSNCIYLNVIQFMISEFLSPSKFLIYIGIDVPCSKNLPVFLLSKQEMNF